MDFINKYWKSFTSFFSLIVSSHHHHHIFVCLLVGMPFAYSSVAVCLLIGMPFAYSSVAVCLLISSCLSILFIYKVSD